MASASCWSCCPPDAPITADQEQCDACKERRRLADEREAEALGVALAEESEKERARFDSDMKAIDAFYQDRRRARFLGKGR